MDRRLPLLTIAATIAVVAPAAAQAPPAPEQRIAAGISVTGVDVSNLLIDEAAAKLRAELQPRFERTLVVRGAGRRYPMDPRTDAELKFDATRSAKRAYYAGLNKPPEQPVLDVPAAVAFSHAAVRRFAGRVDKRVYRAAKDATLRITVRRMLRTKSKPGRDMDARATRAAIEAALANPALSRLIIPPLKQVKPKLTADKLASRYPTVVTIDRANFKLRLFKRLHLVKTYGIAVGAAGYDTPTGRYAITNKAVNPVWNAPNAPWAGLAAGTSVAGGSAANPLKARWLGIANGVGIHGTAAEYSIGSRASHGCIRMRVADVIALYPRVPLGTPVLIK